MKTLKRILFAIAIISIVLTSCKKSGSKKNNNNNNNNTSGYYVKFKVNGVQHNDTRLVLAATVNDTNPKGFITTIGGYSTSESLAITIFSVHALQVNSTFDSIPNAFVTNFINMDYIVGSTGYIDEFTAQDTVTITAITSNTLSGTFSGKLYNTSQQFVTITDGQFYAPYSTKIKI